MFPSTSESPPDIIRAEIFNLLVLLFALLRKPASCVMRSARPDLLAELIAVDCLQDSVILGLSRLADSRTDAWSFRQLIKDPEVRKAIADTASLEELLAKYEIAVKPVKQHQRHERIAHLAKNPQGTPSVYTKELEVLTRQAVQVLDRALGEKQEYVLRVGSKEAPINLRDELQM